MSRVVLPAPLQRPPRTYRTHAHRTPNTPHTTHPPTHAPLRPPHTRTPPPTTHTHPSTHHTLHSGGWLEQGGSNAPLIGGKFADLEGGTRVTAFVSGGVVPAARRGATENGYIHCADWYATILGLAGLDAEQIVDARAAAAGLPPLDSLDVWPLLSGANATSPRVEIPLSANPPGTAGTGFRGHYAVDYTTPPGLEPDSEVALAMAAAAATGQGLGYYVGGEGLIVGPYKLVTGTQHTGPFGNKTFFKWCGDGCLFHILDDPTESCDLAAALPAVLARLQARQAEIRLTVFAPDRGALDPAACAANDAAGGFWAPWLAAPEGWPTFLPTISVG